MRRLTSAIQIHLIKSADINAHSGSAGGGQNASVEIKFEDGRVASRQTNLTEQSAVQDHVTMDELMAKARAGDSAATEIVKGMRQAVNLPEAERQASLEKLQRRADRLYVCGPCSSELLWDVVILLKKWWTRLELSRFYQGLSILGFRGYRRCALFHHAVKLLKSVKLSASSLEWLYSLLIKYLINGECGCQKPDVG